MLKVIKFFTTFSILSVKLQPLYANKNLFTSDQKNTYYIENEQKYSWIDALIKCKRMNMSLITIDMKEKSDEITNLLRKIFKPVNPLWIGAVAIGATSPEYVWVSSGEKMTFTNWSKGEPDFNGKKEYCIQTGWHSNLQWNDNNCYRTYGIICEYDRYYNQQDCTTVKPQGDVNEVQQVEQNLNPKNGTDMNFNININIF